MGIKALRENNISRNLDISWNLCGTTEKGNESDIIPSASYSAGEMQSSSLVLTSLCSSQLKLLVESNSVSMLGVFNFIWHEVLKVFCFSNRTAVASCSLDGELPDNIQKFSFLVLDHKYENEKENRCIDVIAVIEKQLSQDVIGPEQAAISLNSALVFSVDCLSEKNIKFPLLFNVYEDEHAGLGFAIFYDSSLLKKNVISDMLVVASLLSEAVASHPTMKVADLEFVPHEQRQRFEQWNDTWGEYPTSKRFDDLFEEAVAKTPDKEALVYENLSLTYHELHQRTNKLANLFRAQPVGVQANDIIAIFLDTSELTVITVMSIWKSGAAFVPIDPKFPDNRIKFIIDDSKAKRVIANSWHMERLKNIIGSEKKLEIFEVESLFDQINTDDSISPFKEDLQLGSDHPAYLTYTSGTTGLPKSIMKTHRCAVNSITDITRRYGIGTVEESVVLFSPYVFEPFVRQLLTALINSHRLVLINDKDKLDPEKFIYFINKFGITHLHGTGSVLLQYDLSKCPSLVRLVLVGEALTPSRYKQLRNMFKGKIICEYSFTESAFVTAIKEFDENSTRTNISIGKPLRNVTWYVLNQHMKQLPIGAIGELYVGGEGVGKGYWNRSELTEQRFLHNPFQSTLNKSRSFNGTIYKTGDLVRRLDDGEVEYLGRDDLQVKINGVRIEPGEIEAVVLKCPGVKQCIVHSKEVKKGAAEEGARYLLGYFIPENKNITENDVMNHLASQLPRYMIPARMILLKSFPLMINGKVDLNALPDTPPKNNEIRIEARNQLDKKLCGIWSDVLDIPLEDFCIAQSFFRLGGDSISCIQLIARIKRDLNFELTIEELFELQTVKTISDFLVGKMRDHNRSSRLLENTIASQNENSVRWLHNKHSESVFLANGLQQGFMYQYLKRSDQKRDFAYIMQSVFHYKVSINPEYFKSAWEHIQQKYAALRLRFVWESEPLQKILASQNLRWKFIDLTEIENEELQKRELDEIKLNDKSIQYRLESDNLFRVYLIKLKDDRYSLLFSCHHIILDGWSLPIIFDDIHETYWRLANGEAINESNTNATYEDAQEYIQNHRNDHLKYWNDQIDSIQERGDYNGLISESSRYKVVLADYENVREQKYKTLEFDPQSTANIKAHCVELSITLHSVLQFVWHSVLHAIGKGAQTVVGTVISGRNLPVVGIEQSVGLHINTLPLVIDHQTLKQMSVLEAVRYIQAKVFAMNSRSNVELGQLQKGEMKHQLFDTLFVLENHPELDEEQIEQAWYQADYELEKLDYPLAVIAKDNERNGVTFTLCYASEIINDSTISILLDMVKVLYEQLANNIDCKLSELQLMSPDQLHLQQQWNATEKTFPEDVTLHEAFEVVALTHADKTALVYEQTQLKYSELNEHSNQLAFYLRDLLDIKPDMLIALMLDKNEKMFSSILGVWKSGAAYVPIDPEFPSDRVNYILEDTQAKIIITNQRHISKLKEHEKNGIRILEVEELPLANYSTSNPESISTSTDLAYVIYTSGTTGRPKGVMVEHQGVVNLQISLAETFSLKDKQEESFLSFSNYVFDHFVEQMTDALLNGQKLVVLNDEMRSDKLRLYKYMNDNHVTYLSGTPSVLSMYEYDSVGSLTRIDAVGEDFTESLFNKIRSTFNGMIINGYGPTEVSITSHKRPYFKNERRLNKSIGNLVKNIKSYILDENMRLLPAGAIGELYLGGIGVARGYLNREELTQQRFVSNPYQTTKEKAEGRNARVYKTGDVVRWLENGELEYLGREDSQVKIRGLRIELAEIQSVISSYPGISQSVVISRNHENNQNGQLKYLVGFYVSTERISTETIRTFLYTKLPDYMVPNQLIQIDDIPVTVSGKLNTNALPATTFSDDSVEYVAPRNGIELKLCRLWSELLGVAPEKIGINNSFFSLGGDSLLATRLAFLFADAFGKNLGIAGAFTHNTIALQGRWLSEKDGSADRIKLGLSNGLAPVSLSQERLLFIDEFENGSNAYNIVINMSLQENVDFFCLNEAFKSMLIRHSALRTVIIKDDIGSRLQKILEHDQALALFHLKEMIVSNKTELDKILLQEAEYIFSLEAEIPIRVCLIKCNSSLYMSIVVHHVCFDGWSWTVFRRDLEALYGSFLNPAQELRLPNLTIQYIDYSRWQRASLNEAKLKELAQYWENKLRGHEQLNLLTDFQRPSQFNYSGKEYPFQLDLDTTSCLRELSRNAKISFNSLLIGVYCLMLSKFSGQKDIVIGFPVVNRNSSELENVVGFFANMLTLRVAVEPDIPVLNYLQSVSSELINSQIHQEMPFEKLVKYLNIENDPARHPIFQAIFAPDLLDAEDEDGSLTMKRYAPDNNNCTVAKFDLSVWVQETRSGLKGNLTYPISLFNEQTIASYTETYVNLLEQFSAIRLQGNVNIGDVCGVSDKQNNEILLSAIKSYRKFDDSGKTLHSLFECEVRKNPKKSALVYKDNTLTYEELNRKANQLAHLLRTKFSVGARDLVALLLDRNEDIIISILAVWKAGAGYIPIDPKAPENRIKFILEDTGSSCLITNVKNREDVLDSSLLEILLVRLNLNSIQEEIYAQSDCDLNLEVADENLAYVIYTSGTTGQPKGVLIEHKSVVNLRNDLKERYFDADSYEQNSVLFLANYVFDFSVEQIILSILSGNKLIIYCDEHTTDEFYDYVNSQHLTFLSGTPTHICQFDLSRLKGLKTLLVAGEAFTDNHFSKIKKEFRGRLINAYGVTEATVYNTIKIFDEEDHYQNILGEPLSNMGVLVLDEQLRLVPRGAVGELYLTGDCISRGYLNRPELTKERFIASPYQTESQKSLGQSAKLYKTGDLVQFLSNGDLKYLGRNDFQVKINGLRVELGEVESVLSTFPGIKQCTVIVSGGEKSEVEKYLVAYFVSDDPANTESLLLAFLKQKLPSYMVPTRIVRVDGQIPITINGKVDVKALPKVGFAVSPIGYHAPRNELEALLCRIWSEVLRKPDTGIDDDFFSNGGDSILAMTLVSNIQRKLKQSIRVKDIFTYKTVRALYDNVLANSSVPDTYDTEQGMLQGAVPMLPIQDWFFAKDMVSRDHWNQFFAVNTPAMDVALLERSINKLVNYHDVFRLFYTKTAATYEQYYSDKEIDFKLDVLDVRGLSEEQIKSTLEELQSNFDLAKGEAFRVCYLHGFDHGNSLVWFAVHHLIIDTVSWRILIQDLRRLYSGSELGKKNSSYRQWTQAIGEYTGSPTERLFWKEIFDRPSDNLENYVKLQDSFAKYYFSLGKEETRSLLVECRYAYNTQISELLLTAVGHALKDITGHSSHYLTLEGHGREDIKSTLNINNTVGWFTSMYPFMVEVTDDVGATIEKVKCGLQKIPNKGIGYGAIHGYTEKPLPKVSFNYLGQFTDNDKDELWTLADKYCGSSRPEVDELANDSIIDVTVIIAGQIKFEVHTRLEERVAKHFVESIESALRQIINITVNSASVSQPLAYKNSMTSLPLAQFDPYVEFNSELLDRPVLFILPPGEGGAESYFNNICRHLTEFRLVVFNNYYLHHNSPDISFEELALYYLDFVKQIQPCGPYHFLGWSFGGVISFEISRQLAAAGEKIANLILIDSYFNVKKASYDIGRPDETTIIDKINYYYAPHQESLIKLTKETGNIVLLKAMEMNEAYNNRSQEGLYRYYQTTPYNNLDTLVDQKVVLLIKLLKDDHSSWVNNEKVLAVLGFLLTSWAVKGGKRADVVGSAEFEQIMEIFGSNRYISLEAEEKGLIEN